MALVKLKPTSPGCRGVARVATPELYQGPPHWPLLEKQTRAIGRNNQGRITKRHRGGGHKQQYRIIDFKRDKDGIPARVERVEYDPNRSAHIALLLYVDGERRYIIAPKSVQSGSKLMSGSQAPIEPGNCLPLRNIPLGTTVHCVEMQAGRGAQRWRGKRPTVRGVAMNPVDHPHGGGEGKTSGGRHPVSPWGQPTKGHKTRRNKRTRRMIVRRRNSGS